MAKSYKEDPAPVEDIHPVQGLANLCDIHKTLVRHRVGTNILDSVLHENQKMPILAMSVGQEGVSRLEVDFNQIVRWDNCPEPEARARLKASLGLVYEHYYRTYLLALRDLRTQLGVLIRQLSGETPEQGLERAFSETGYDELCGLLDTKMAEVLRLAARYSELVEQFDEGADDPSVVICDGVHVPLSRLLEFAAEADGPDLPQLLSRVKRSLFEEGSQHLQQLLVAELSFCGSVAGAISHIFSGEAL